jgi:hypothetical protein
MGRRRLAQYGQRVKVYIVSDHQDGAYGRIAGVFDSPEKGAALIQRYGDAYESDEPWPPDLDAAVYVAGLAVDGYEVTLERLAEAEAIIVALRALQQAMYDSDLEAGWPRNATELQSAYEEKYNVNLYPEGY